MICVVLHCDHADCGTEQGYSIESLAGHKADGETLVLTAARLGAQTGWQVTTEFGHGLYDGKSSVFCGDHNT